MKARIIFVLLLVSIIISSLNDFSFASVNAVDYLCETGMTFYRSGRFDDALQEFNKALATDPSNNVAKFYVNKIFEAKINPLILPPQPQVATKQPHYLNRDDAMNRTMMKLAQAQTGPPTMVAGDKRAKRKLYKDQPEEESKYSTPGLIISGDMQMSAGSTSNDFIWKRANYDMNERNWRMISTEALNNKFNTYDARIYDSMNMDLDTDNADGLNFHTNVTVDPWSFTGKSEKFTVTGSSASKDYAQMETKYWSNTGYSVNETIYTLKSGDSFNAPELKVVGSHTDSFTKASEFGNNFNVPGVKINRQFQPIREFWFDYNNDVTNWRFFPIGYQDQGGTSDDPLAIANHHIWWEDSLWLRRYKPGNFNYGANPVDYTKGYWDNSLSFLSRDSNGMYLTALRGFSFNYQPQEGTSLAATVASPKDLWQNYEEIDNVASSLRLKHLLRDNLALGGTFTDRTGFKVTDNNHMDSKYYVGGLDLGYELFGGVKLAGEALTSRSKYDVNDDRFRTKAQGNAYYFSAVARYPVESIMDLKYGYDEIKLGKGDTFLNKAKFYMAQMDAGFDSALSTYRNTRSDTFWSRHITFRKPFEYYYSGLKYPGLKWDEINATRIGDGIDVGRQVLGLRIETIAKDKFSNLFDVRNVHKTNGKFVENVARDELMVKLTDKLTTKLLGIYHRLPRTYGGIDPFIIDPLTGDFVKDWSATPIKDGLNASLKTGSLGLEYAFYDWLSLNGVWEATNDYNLGYSNFPRSVFNGQQQGRIYSEDYNTYRGTQHFVYDQQYFPQPPYHFYNIFKSGLRILPVDNMEIYLDYTRNEFEIAGQNSDNMNHIGFEIAYLPTKKVGLSFKYNYSQWKNITKLAAGTGAMGHHNFFGEFRYLPSKEDEFILQYGEGNTSPIGNITFDPYGGALLTIDTQHIFRAYYRRKF